MSRKRTISSNDPRPYSQYPAPKLSQQTSNFKHPTNYIFLIANDFPEGLAKTMRIRAYARGLKELGEQVQVWSGYSSSFNRPGYNRKVRGEWRGIPYLQLSGTTGYKRALYFRTWVWLRANLFLLWMLFRERKKGNAYLAYMPSTKGLLIGMRLAKVLFGQEFVLIETEFYSQLQTGVDTARLSKLEQFKKRFAKQILVVTPELEKAYGALPGAASVSRIAPVVAELDRFSSLGLKNTHTLGYVGTFGDKDGIPTLLKAFESARKQIPQLRLQLMGKPEADPGPLPEGASMTGSFLTEELPALLAQCDSLVVNRKDDAYSRHGFPIKLAEYTATGIPVLLCDFDFYHQFLTEQEVWYFKADDPEALCGAILNRYANEEIAGKKAAAALLKCQQHFSHTEAARELVEVVMRGRR